MIHVAIIMDGNGRWARRRRLPRVAGHRHGSRAVRKVVETAAGSDLGIGTLTLYAFSSDNWQRPADEVAGVMALLGEYLRRETSRCIANGIRLQVVGRRDRLAPDLLTRIVEAERATAGGDRLTLRIAVDYSSRDVITRAALLVADATPAQGPGHPPLRELTGAAVGGAASASRDALRALLARAEGPHEPAPDVDLLIRTGGEQRLSDFLLWECAYAELYFTSTLWPEFGAGELRAAVAEYGRRERRFGRVLDEAV